MAIRQLQGRQGEAAKPTANAPRANKWRDVESTTRFGNEWHIGRKDERSFRDPDDFFSSVYVDTYVSKSSNLRGLSVRNIQPKIASKYGVQAGDVLIEVNGRAVTSKGQAVNMVKKSYNRGVRTFSTKWLSNGQEVERVYQAPNQKK
jgi:type II secretory pathway component PulC